MGPWSPHRHLSKLGGGGVWGVLHTRTGPGRPPPGGAHHRCLAQGHPSPTSRHWATGGAGGRSLSLLAGSSSSNIVFAGSSGRPRGNGRWAPLPVGGSIIINFFFVTVLHVSSNGWRQDIVKGTAPRFFPFGTILSLPGTMACRYGFPAASTSHAEGAFVPRQGPNAVVKPWSDPLGKLAMYTPEFSLDGRASLVIHGAGLRGVKPWRPRRASALRPGPPARRGVLWHTAGLSYFGWRQGRTPSQRDRAGQARHSRPGQGRAGRKSASSGAMFTASPFRIPRGTVTTLPSMEGTFCWGAWHPNECSGHLSRCLTPRHHSLLQSRNPKHNKAFLIG